MQLISKIRTFIQQNNLIKPDDKLIVGVSGGVDSVALLDILQKLDGFRLKLVIAHLNHNLRGTESNQDQLFVEELAKQHRLPCEIRSLNVQQIASAHGISVEEAGREARYAFFEELRQKHNAALIVVAHHADDQAETLLMRLIRGAGSTGLSAMAPSGPGYLVRPLLQTSRKELEDYIMQSHLRFREDSSNSDRSYLRNRVRHELLPLLENYNPGMAQRLAETAFLIRDENRLLKGFIFEKAAKIKSSGNGWIALSRTGLAEMEQPLRLMIYRSVIEQVCGSLRKLYRPHLLSMDSLFSAGHSGSRLELPGNLEVHLTPHDLVVAKCGTLTLENIPETLISAPGVYCLTSLISLTVSEAATAQTGQDDIYSISLPADQAPFPWTVRACKSGDKIQPEGMTGHKSIKELLIELKVPAFLRRAIPLIVSNEKVLSVAGLKRSDSARLTDRTQKVITIRFNGMEKLPLLPVKN